MGRSTSKETSTEPQTYKPNKQTTNRQRHNQTTKHSRKSIQAIGSKHHPFTLRATCWEGAQWRRAVHLLLADMGRAAVDTRQGWVQTCFEGPGSKKGVQMNEKIEKAHFPGLFQDPWWVFLGAATIPTNPRFKPRASSVE